MIRSLPLSENAVSLARDVLSRRGVNLEDSARVAPLVKKLSDWFIANPDGQTPWSDAEIASAYFAYYLPLNELRARAVAQEGLQVGFFRGLTDVVDFGAGPATASLALRDTVPSLEHFRLIERSPVPARLLEGSGFSFQTSWTPDILKEPARTLFVASYSLTEGELPREALNAEALMLIEPSTQDDGRRLLELRRRLLSEGYFAWAPCPHQLGCPLLEDSRRDWCHDRVHVERPEWLVSLESHLPFRNQTVTFSYLLLRKTAPPAPTWARLVGDRLEENGKDRQLVCRGAKREFLAWMHRKGTPPDLPRGLRVHLPSDAPVAGNELRVAPGDITPLDEKE